MEYEWYADLFFLEEAYRDVLVLWLAAVLGRRRITLPRLFAAGIAGGICGTVAVFLDLSGIAPWAADGSWIVSGIWEIGKILLSGGIMIRIAFPQKKISGRIVLRQVGVLILSAGILQSGLAILRERWFLTGWKSLFFMGFFCVGVRFFAAAVVKGPAIGKTRYQVRLFLNGRTKDFTAMVDSGNRLVEPVTGKPVSIIAEADAAEFGNEPVGILMIPYRAVGTKKGMLPGVLFDRMEIRSEESGNRKIDRPIVAISKEPLFFEKDFTMILPECLVTGERT